MSKDRNILIISFPRQQALQLAHTHTVTGQYLVWLFEITRKTPLSPPVLWGRSAALVWIRSVTEPPSSSFTFIYYWEHLEIRREKHKWWLLKLFSFGFALHCFIICDGTEAQNTTTFWKTNKIWVKKRNISQHVTFQKTWHFGRWNTRENTTFR